MYDKQLQAYIFTDNNALGPVDTIMCIIFHKQTRRNSR